MRLLIKIISFFLLVSCSFPPSIDTLGTIDIEKVFDRTDKILLSDFCTDEIEYIILETLPESLITGTLKVLVNDKYIIAFSLRNTLLFDRKTGKFIRLIAYAGPGSNDYVHSSENTAFDENRETIMRGSISGGGIEYDLEGNVIRKIRFLDNDKRGSLIPLDENSFAKYINNFTGDEPDKLYIFDKEGYEVNRFQNHHSFEAIPGSYSSRGPITYKWRNDIFFYENCVDTLYKITRDSLIPYLRFELGKYHPPYSEIPNLTLSFEKPLMNKYFSFNTINESDRFLFFSFYHDKKYRVRETGKGPPLSKYFGFYDKQSGITKVSEVDHTDKSPVINDIDDFAPLYPFTRNINQSCEMSTYMEAEDIIDWFEENPDKAKKLPEHLQTLSKLKFDDNPVVVIVKLKE